MWAKGPSSAAEGCAKDDLLEIGAAKRAFCGAFVGVDSGALSESWPHRIAIRKSIFWLTGLPILDNLKKLSQKRSATSSRAAARLRFPDPGGPLRRFSGVDL